MSGEHKRQPIPPKLGIVIGILAVSTASIFIRFVQRESVASIVIAAYRLGIATIVLSPVVLIKHRQEISKLSRIDLRFSLLSGFFLAIHFAAWISSLEFTSVASSVVLVTTTPLWVAIFSPIALKEKISRTVSIGLGVALLGTIVIGLSDVCRLEGGVVCPSFGEFFSGDAVWGDFLALVGAWTAAGYVLIGRRVRSTLSLTPYIFIVYGVAAVILIVLMMLSGDSFYGFAPMTIVWLVLLALVPQLIGHSTFNWALGYLPAAYVAITLLGEPIGSTILAYIFLDEVPGLLLMVGAILIFGGIVIASRTYET